MVPGHTWGTEIVRQHGFRRTSTCASINGPVTESRHLSPFPTARAALPGGDIAGDPAGLRAGRFVTLNAAGTHRATRPRRWGARNWPNGAAGRSSCVRGAMDSLERRLVRAGLSREAGVRPSKGSAGDAMCESLFATLESSCRSVAGSRPGPRPGRNVSASSRAGTTRPAPFAPAIPIAHGLTMRS